VAGLAAFVALAALHLPAVAVAQAPEDRSTFKVVGYLAGWGNQDFQQVDVTRLTHLNYAFANIRDGEVWVGDAIDGVALSPARLDAAVALRERNPQLKVLLSVGGWTWSKDFSDVALTPESRAKFAASAARVAREHRLDGIDLDWEYPGQIGDNNKFRPEDKENFTLLLQAVREALDDLARREDHPPYLLTIASGANDAYLAHTNLGEAQRYLDFINVMTYDFHHGLDYVAGHHSNLRRSRAAGASEISVVDAVQGHLQAGVPAAKLVVGVPFYGRQWRGVPPQQHGLYQRGTTTGEIIAYRDIAEKYLGNPQFVVHWDAAAEAPYLHSAADQIIVTYDTPEALRRKVRYVREQGLAGLMFWEYSLDRQGELLGAIADELAK
jgi:chitinase